ncbi:MAG: 2-phospho-L-lactate transferase CofD family protein [Syntrophobacteraceae bacterium]
MGTNRGALPEMNRDQLGKQVEQLLEAVVNGVVPEEADKGALSLPAEEVYSFDCRKTRVVAFGGGTGLSTVVGGNSQLHDWPDDPFIGLKQEFPLLDVVVCTTDDGGSTGLLLQQLPIIGIGDLRKLLLSLILHDDLRAMYGLDEGETMQLVRLIHGVFNHRFAADCNDFEYVSNPLRIVSESLREACPEPLAGLLGSLGRYVAPRGGGPTIMPGGHCLGNLILTAAIFREVAGRENDPPALEAVERGLDTIAKAIGVVPGRLHPATPTPGQLVLRYSNGVAVRGQCKPALCRRDFPIDSVAVEFSGNPVISQSLCRGIREADLILFAPGSLYTSILPILQLPAIVEAIKENKKALKILGANFWIQEGETDISRRGRNRGFYVSELVEAYEQNVPGGAGGLFDVVLSANLEHVPGNVLSNYALEGKSPIYLDRNRVERFGVLPIEATIYSRERLSLAHVIHHDPLKFALAVRALLFAHERFSLKRESVALPGSLAPLPDRGTAHAPVLCAYKKTVSGALDGKRFLPGELRKVFDEVVWENRDIRVDHFKFFRGACIIPAGEWNRSNEWDNVLGYYDPEDGMLKMHEQLLKDRERLKGNLLIALGESLLGRYLEGRRWLDLEADGEWGARCYEIVLRPVAERDCFLDDSELRAYLCLARMVPNPNDARSYRITLNGNEGFTPPGLLFGLLYAWYLNNIYGEIMEYEMSLLRWPSHRLIPCQLEERNRKLALIGFFRKVVFKHPD